MDADKQLVGNMISHSLRDLSLAVIVASDTSSDPHDVLLCGTVLIFKCLLLPIKSLVFFLRGIKFRIKSAGEDVY